MAFVRSKTHASLAVTSSNITPELPNYEAGDLLIAYALSDGNRSITVDAAWTVLEQGIGFSGCGVSVCYIENATGNETPPVFSLSVDDTATAIVVAIGGAATSNAIEAETATVTTTLNRQEAVFTGVTTLTDNALVLHLFGNSTVQGCATDQNLLRVSDEIGYVGESAYVFEETVPTAGSSSSGKMFQYGNTAGVYKSLSIVDGSGGTLIKPVQIGGGTDIINMFHGQETATWLIGGINPSTTPSDVTSEANYGDILGKTFRVLEGVQDTADSNVNPFIAAGRFRIDRGDFYSGLRFGMDRFGTGGTRDITGDKALVVTIHQINLQNSVKLQLKSSIGYSIVLESGVDDYDNYVIHTVSGSDSSSPKVTPLDGPCLLSVDYTNPIKSSGSFDANNILKVGLIAASLNAPNLNVYFCNLGILSPIELVGGSPTLPINQKYLFDASYANLHYFIKNSGDFINSYTPWHFGNGAIDTFVDLQGKSFTFPEQGADSGALVNDTFFGLRIESTANSDINCEGMTLSSPSPLYLDIVNGLGGINFISSTINNTQTCNIRGDFTGAVFNPVAGTFIDDFNASIDDVKVNGVLRLNSVRDLTNIEATKIVVQNAGTYNFNGVSVDEVENISGGSVVIYTDTPPSITNTGVGSNSEIINTNYYYPSNGEVITNNYPRVIAGVGVTSITFSGVYIPEVEVTGGQALTVFGVDNAKATNAVLTETNGTITLDDDLVPSVNWVENTSEVVLTTGSETDLTGLRGLEGVDFEVTGSFTTYYTSKRIQVNAGTTLTINPETEKVVFLADSVVNEIHVYGTLIVEGRTTVNGFTKYSTNYFAESYREGTVRWKEEDAVIRVENNGTLDWRGGGINAIASIFFLTGSIIILDNALIQLNTGAEEWQIRSFSTNLSILSIIANASFLFYENPNVDVTGVGSVQTSFALMTYGSSAGLITYRDYLGKGNTVDISLLDDGQSIAVNSEEGSLTKTGLFAGYATTGTTRHRGRVKYNKEFNINFKNLNSDNLENVRYYIKDYNNGNRQNSLMGDDTADQILTGLSNTSGNVVTQTITTAIVNKSDTAYEHPLSISYYDYRDKNGDGSDVFDMYFLGYGYQIAQTAQILKGIGEQSINWTLFEDLLTTEPDEVTVRAYTNQENPYKVYDQLVTVLMDSYQAEIETIVTRVNDTLDCRDLNLVIDGTGSGTPTLVGNTLTIYASTFTGNIITTGVVSTINGANIVGGIVDANGDSYITFSGYFGSEELYTNELDARRDENSIGSFTTSDIYRFNFTGFTNYYMFIDGIMVTIPVVTSGETAQTFSLNATVSQVKAVTDKLNTMLEIGTGDMYKYTQESLSGAPSTDVNAIADAVWDEAYADHTTAGTFGKLMDLVRKSNRVIEGTLSGAHSLSSIQTDLTGYTDGTFDHELLVFVSGTLEGLARPILSYSVTNGEIIFQEDLPSVPTDNDEFIISASHVHPVEEMASAVRTELTTELSDITLAKDNAIAANVQTKKS